MVEAHGQRKSFVKRRGCLHSIGKFLLVSLSILVLLIPIGMIYQSSSIQMDRKQFPPPGWLVNLDGFSLHIYCTGAGSPTVILESGLGDGSFIWGRVTDLLAKNTRVCVYDRPGLGWSDFVRQPFDRNGVAQNLHNLLTNAAIPGPYILAGHSIGGLYIRAFTQKYPNEVAGLVFVDSAHENQSGRMTNRRNNAGITLDHMLKFCEVIAPTGVFRLFGLGEILMEDTGLPESIRKAAASTLNRSTYCRTIANELNTSDKDTSLSDPPKTLGDIPLIVLVAGQDIGGHQGGASTTTLNEISGLNGSRWLRLQQGLADLSTQGRLIIAEQSSHYIHLDQPELVVHAVQEVLEKVR